MNSPVRGRLREDDDTSVLDRGVLAGGRTIEWPLWSKLAVRCERRVVAVLGPFVVLERL